jgi:hypothetical protein
MIRIAITPAAFEALAATLSRLAASTGRWDSLIWLSGRPDRSNKKIGDALEARRRRLFG